MFSYQHIKIKSHLEKVAFDFNNPSCLFLLNSTALILFRLPLQGEVSRLCRDGGCCGGGCY